MQLFDASHHILRQLSDVVQSISDADFVRPSAALSGSTLGQHLRHTLEFFLCLEKGLPKGVVNYDNREHDKLIESDRYLALATIGRIAGFVSQHQEDLPLKLEVGYDRHSPDFVEIDTNYFRELTYNIEHAVHHMAIMKIGLREVAPSVRVPGDFGVAVSTLRYQETMGSRVENHG